MKARWLVLAALLGVAQACDTGTDPILTPGDPQNAPATQPVELTLGYGGDVVVAGTILRVSFGQVLEDSRCPVDVVCVWQGNAKVEIGLALGSGPTVAFPLSTALDPRYVDYGGYRVTLLGVTPEAHSETTIRQEDYSIRLRIETL